MGRHPSRETSPTTRRWGGRRFDSGHLLEHRPCQRSRRRLRYPGLVLPIRDVRVFDREVAISSNKLEGSGNGNV
jgi:hypothetical protein